MGDIQEPVIEVRNLRVDFPSRRGTVTALSDVSLSIRPGRFSASSANPARASP